MPYQKGRGWRGCVLPIGCNSCRPRPATALSPSIWMQYLSTTTRHRDLPSSEGPGVCIIMTIIIPPPLSKGEGLTRLYSSIWMQYLPTTTRHRDLPSLEGSGVCINDYNHTPSPFQKGRGWRGCILPFGCNSCRPRPATATSPFSWMQYLPTTTRHRALPS